MPGIVGLITNRNTSDARAELVAMLKAIQYESFYSSGTWSDGNLGVYCGWTALPGSFCDGMPIANSSGTACLIFSGEEYSDNRKGRQACALCVAAPESAYLMRLYEGNPNFVQTLNGMFHGVLADRRLGVVQLFNDRYGMHPFYYHDAGDTFYFSAEAKAILAVRPELRACDLKSLGEFVACSCILENRTLFTNIHALPAASCWTFRGGQLESKQTYFDPRQWEEQTSLSPAAYIEELRSVLSNTLPRYFAGRERLGMAMTGGLDTRVILASHPPAPGELPGYTFGSSLRDTYDVRIGRQVAKMCSQPHQVIEVGKEFLADFPSYAQRSVFVTEGTVDLCRTSDLYASEKVREIAPAKIVGTYGSEIVRHAVMFKAVPPAEGVFSTDFLRYVREAGDTYTNLRREHPVTFAAFRQSPWYHHGVLALEQSQITVRSPFMDNEFVRTAYRAPKENHDEDVRLDLIRMGNPALARIRSDRGVGSNGSRLTSFLARTSREFTFKAEYAYDEGMPQPVARIDHLLSGLRLERLFLGRHKLLHYRTWYRHQLADYVQQILLDPITLSRPYLQRKTVEALVAQHIKGSANFTTAIHKLLTLELFQRSFVSER